MDVDVEARPVVDIQEAMRVTGVSRRTIYNWMNNARVEFVRTAGGSPRIFRDSLFRAARVRTPDDADG